MKNFEKPLNEFTERELQDRVNTWAPQYGALALYELQRRQQYGSLNQIQSLREEVAELKKIAEKNENTSVIKERSNRLVALVAISISVFGILAQVALDIERVDRCYEQNKETWCITYIEAGIFGQHIIPERKLSN